MCTSQTIGPTWAKITHSVVCCLYCLCCHQWITASELRELCDRCPLKRCKLFITILYSLQEQGTLAASASASLPPASILYNNTRSRKVRIISSKII